MHQSDFQYFDKVFAVVPIAFLHDAKQKIARFFEPFEGIVFDALREPKHLRTVGGGVAVGQRIATQNQGNALRIFPKESQTSVHQRAVEPSGETAVLLKKRLYYGFLANGVKGLIICQVAHKTAQCGSSTL